MTLFSEHYKCIFIAIPKTATRSITRLLRDDCGFYRNKLLVDGKAVKVREHTPATEIKNIMGEAFHEYTKVAILRDPIDRVKSHYNFIRYKNQNKNKPKAKKAFKGQARRLLTRMTPFYLWLMGYHFQTSKSFLCDEDGNLLVDYFGYFENLDPEFYQLMQGVGIDMANKVLKHRNHNNGKKDFPVNEKWVFNKAVLEDLAFYRWVTANVPNRLPTANSITEKLEY